MEYVSFLFHMYQPPWQYNNILRKINKECYGWLTKWIADSDFKVAININYSLTEHLVSLGLEDVIKNLCRGAEKGNVEFTDSAAYHALLPLLPKSEAIRQIELNNKKNKEVFGDLWKPKGVFPPELAASNEIFKIIKDLGYKWSLNEDTVYESEKRIAKPDDFIAQIEGLSVFFRSRWSNKFAMDFPNCGNTNMESFVNEMHKSIKANKKNYHVLAFDMETIGHHQPYNKDSMDYLNMQMKKVGIKNVCISDLLNEFPKKNIEGNYAGSWSTSKEDIAKKIYYPLWKHPNNRVHSLQWKLMEYAVEKVNESGSSRARELLDKGLNSCHQWWADDCRWNSLHVKTGIDDIIKAIRIVDSDDPEGERIYSQLMREIKDKDLAKKRI